MRNILLPAHRRILRRHAGAALVLDFDGTLAPIVDDPAGAAMRPRTRRQLARLARRRPCAVLSGRSLRDLKPRLAGVPLACVVGNHGLEWEQARRGGGNTRRIRAWKVLLRGLLGGMPGVVVEDKGHTLSVHYRRAPDRKGASRRVRAAAGRLTGARLVGGKDILSVLPASSAGKGGAALRLRARLRRPGIIYVGDDVTDEEAFGIPGKLLAIRVGRNLRSRAPWYIPGQRQADALLQALLEETRG